MKKRVIWMTTPEYPLRLEVISEACENLGLSYRIETGTQTDAISNYSLRNEKHELVASIKSQCTKEERRLGITFYSNSTKINVTQEGKEIILLATRLIGGLKNDEQVYNRFVKEFNPLKESCWQASIEAVSCEIELDVLPEVQTTVMNIGLILRK